ncbi:MAG: hypothetical protein O7G83_01500, partial [Proteobacteria bacterium]|nr:hypothetical protein [Pseudomonadota bacterium]
MRLVCFAFTMLAVFSTARASGQSEEFTITINLDATDGSARVRRFSPSIIDYEPLSAGDNTLDVDPGFYLIFTAAGLGTVGRFHVEADGSITIVLDPTSSMSVMDELGNPLVDEFGSPLLQLSGKPITINLDATDLSADFFRLGSLRAGNTLFRLLGGTNYRIATPKGQGVVGQFDIDENGSIILAPDSTSSMSVVDAIGNPLLDECGNSVLQLTGTDMSINLDATNLSATFRYLSNLQAGNTVFRLLRGTKYEIGTPKSQGSVGKFDVEEDGSISIV